MATNVQNLKLDVHTLVPEHGKEIKKAGAASPQSSPSKSWRSLASTCVTQSAALRKMWSEPDWTTFKVRSKTYLADKLKVTTEEPMFELVWFDLFCGDHDDLLHICQHPASFAQKAIARFGNEVPQLFVVTLLIPGTPVVACVQYFALKSDLSSEHSTEANELWKKFLEGDSAFRSDRFKLIPSIADGPWIIKKSVGTKPVILGHALQMLYYQTPHYLEACVDICSDRVAKHVTGMVRSQSTYVKVDMGFVVEAQSESELPERLLGCVQYDRIDVKLATPIKETQSSRQAKRLGKLAAKEKETATAAEEEEEEEEEEELEEKRPVSAGFAFLADSDSDSDESEEEEQEEEEEEEAVVVAAPAPANKNAKKNKNKGKPGTALPDSDDVDELLDALATQTGGLSVGQSSTTHRNAENSIFSVQLSMINADKEMKRIFGVREGRETTTAGARRVDPRNAARKTTKKVSMITPHDEWPRPPTFVGGGIRWTKANKPQGPAWNSLCQYFEITWSMAYKKAQEEFEVLQQTHDPNLIAHFLQRYPFHIDALLQMSEVFQHHGQNDHSADCIKRCMYVLELAWADQFDVTKGDCRMDIHTEHNEGFYKALFLLMKQVGRRGCMRSAFETAKLLLGLDPSGDPMSAMLAVDYYALSARQYQFVIDLYEEKLEAVDRYDKDAKAAAAKKAGKRGNNSTGSDDNISALPNVQLSLALAYYHLDKQDEAKEALARALLRFPTVLKPLLEKVAVNTSSASWQSVLGSRVFANAKSVDENGPLQHVLDIYVKRNHTLWKVNEVQSFLLKGAQYAISSGLAAAYPQVVELPPSLTKYKRSYPGDYSDEITTLPPDHPMLQPPQVPAQFDLNDLNDEQLAQLAHLQQQAEEGNLPADANPLLLFLQTLLPWNRVQGAGAAPPPPAPDAPPQ